METRGNRPVPTSVSVTPVDRANDAREKVARKYEYLPPGQLPQTVKSPDWTARWVRFRLKNSDDPKNIGMHRRDGYVPVTYEQRAEVLLDPDSVLPSASGNIEIGDVMLCRRAAERSLARRNYYANLTSEQIRGAKHVAKKEEDARYPGTIEDNSTTSFQAARQKVAEFAD